MSLLHFILDLAALLLWINWRAKPYDALATATPATLVGTLRRAEARPAKRWHFLLALLGLLLLRAGLLPDRKNSQGNTSLHAAYAFSPEVVDFLITSGASSTARNANGSTPVEVSASSTSRIAMPGQEGYNRSVSGLFIGRL